MKYIKVILFVFNRRFLRLAKQVNLLCTHLSKTFILLSILALVFVCSCQEQRSRREITRLVNAWQGREIVFPDTNVFTRYGEDTVYCRIPNVPYKVLMYADTIGCFSCKLRLEQWAAFVDEVNISNRDSVAFLFYFSTTNTKKMGDMLKEHLFDLLIFNHNGQLLKNYAIDRKIGFIEVSPDGKTVYATVSDPEDAIVRFNLE